MSTRNGKMSSNDAKATGEIILENDRILSVYEAKIRCLKTSNDRYEQEIKEYEKKIQQLSSEQEKFPSLEPVQYIKESITKASQINYTSLWDYKVLENCMNEQIKQKEGEIEQTKLECENLFFDTIEKLKQKSEYQEMVTVKSECLKLDMEKREREFKEELQKKIYKEMTEIQNKLYYNKFVKIAEAYLQNQEENKLKQMNIKLKKAIQELSVLQEAVKLKQQMEPVYHREKLGMLSKITLEKPPEKSREKPEIKIEPKTVVPQGTILQDLGRMFAETLSQDASATITSAQENIVKPSKIRVLDSKILAPSFASQLPPPAIKVKRKKRVIDVASQYRKITEKAEKRKLNSSIDRLSQQSQASQLSQNYQQESQKSTQQSQINTQIDTQPETQRIQTQTQYSTVLIEDTQMTTQDELNEQIEEENYDEYVRQTPSMVMEYAEEIAPSPTPRLQSIMKNSQNSQIRNSHNSHSENTRTPVKNKVEKPPFVKPATPTFSEPPKTVRFNLDREVNKKENGNSNTGIFGKDFGFGPTSFTPFFGGGAMLGKEEKSAPDNLMNNTPFNNSMLNMTDMDTSIAGPINSPEFSYEEETPTNTENKQEQKQGGFLSGFGGGFSFGGGGGMFNF